MTKDERSDSEESDDEQDIVDGDVDKDKWWSSFFFVSSCMNVVVHSCSERMMIFHFFLERSI